MPLSTLSPLDRLKSMFEWSGSFAETRPFTRCRFLEEIITIGHQAADLAVTAPETKIPPLITQAAIICAKNLTEAAPINGCTDLNNISDFIHDTCAVPETLQSPLKAALYARWKTVKQADAAWLAEAFAIERVRRKEHCLRVAMAHGITDNDDIDALMQVAAQGMAGLRTYRGENCISVAEEHGIDNDDAFEAIEIFSVMGRAGERVHGGENCEVVAEEHGINLDDNIMDALEMVAVKGLAGKRVREGERVRVVAAAHGIQRGSIAMDKLKAIARTVETPAKRPRLA